MKNINIMTADDCTGEDPYDVDMEGRLIIINPHWFKDECIDAKYQLVKCTGGFGSKPGARGNAIYCKELYEGGEEYRMERRERMVLGFPTEKAVTEWKAEYGEFVEVER